jgi:hypothetical protein
LEKCRSRKDDDDDDDEDCCCCCCCGRCSWCGVARGAVEFEACVASGRSWRHGGRGSAPSASAAGRLGTAPSGPCLEPARLVADDGGAEEEEDEEAGSLRIAGAELPNNNAVVVFDDRSLVLVVAAAETTYGFGRRRQRPGRGAIPQHVEEE